VTRDYNFWVYIFTNRNDSVLDIGVANSLSRRAWKHRGSVGANFPARYQCNKLIYYEHYRDIRDAIARESQLKKWSRAKKIALINRMNPNWIDLGTEELQDR
jgi:putative endonuclease